MAVAEIIMFVILIWGSHLWLNLWQCRLVSQFVSHLAEWVSARHE